ncbi:MAG: recombinase family protein [Planctomycetaceae bacterium]
MANANGKPLRFGVLIRVSTERQERKGESLRTQEKQTSYAVTSMGGTVTRRYAGQEHATAVYEREQLEALLADAALRHPPFDAVMVADPTRWSRDNAVSQKGLEHLRDRGIRFFVLQQEYRLHEPHDLFVLALSSNIGGLQAGVQKQKSLLNRIERARAGVPACGKLPYGRTYDRDTGKWGVDADKQRQIIEIARRYLAGESLPALARAYGHNHSNLHKLLTRRCGTGWMQRFDADDLDIHAEVPTTIPALLPDATIAAILQRAAANRTYLHGRYRADANPYLLSGYVYCGACGYGMFGQTNHNGHRYYRHAHTTRVKACTCTPRPWVRSDELEAAVVNQLFETFGNPAAVERALDECTPNHKEVAAARERVNRIESSWPKRTGT